MKPRRTRWSQQNPPAGDGAAIPPAPGNPPAAPPAAPPAPPAPPAAPPADGGSGGEGAVPYARFREVNDELQKLRKADEKRQADALAATGQHEQLAAQEKAKREEAERRAERVARRAAFVGKAAGKVADVEAAFKLALADGLVTFDVDEEGAPKDGKAVDAVIDEVVKKYPFLKGQGTPDHNFGGNHGATPPGMPVDPEKMTPIEMMTYGIAQSTVTGRGAGSRS